jgi:predicted metal-dependent peptidase
MSTTIPVSIRNPALAMSSAPTASAPAAAPKVPANVLAKAMENLSAGRLIVRNKLPYFRAMLLKLIPVERPGMGTVGVTKDGFLVFDPIVVATWTPTEVAGALVHELMHLFLKHHERTGDRDDYEFNCAGDRAINPGIDQVGLKLPLGGGLRPSDIGAPDGLTADEYYRIAQQKGGGGGKGGKQGAKLGTGHCGSCAGHALPNEPAGKKPLDGGDGEKKDEQQADDPGPGRTKAEMERAARQTAEAMKEEASKNRGTVPGGWLKAADGYLQKPKVRWDEKFKHALRVGVGMRQGAVQHRYDKPSRRQAGLGYGPGAPVLPRYYAPVPRVAWLQDTSGSMGGKETRLALTEANYVVKSLGAEMDFCAVDAEVHALVKVKTIEEVIANLKGGGGTFLSPGIQALDEMANPPDVLVIATDGYIEGEPYKPKNIPNVIWLVIGKTRRRPAKWGTVIEVDDDGAEQLGAEDDDAEDAA